MSTVITVCPNCGSEKLLSQEFQDGLNHRLHRAEKCHLCSAIDFRAHFNVLCPPIYRETDKTRLNQKALRQALSWKMGPRGLLLAGPSGTGKTRIAWLVLEQAAVSQFTAFDCVSFGRILGQRYKEERAEEWLMEVAACPLVFFDDLGKLKLTDRVESELFGVIDYRCSHKLPIIATTENTGASLAGRMTEERRHGLVRRLREFCEVVPFS